MTKQKVVTKFSKVYFVNKFASHLLFQNRFTLRQLSLALKSNNQKYYWLSTKYQLNQNLLYTKKVSAPSMEVIWDDDMQLYTPLGRL